jgi:hypothetical protein
VKDKNSRILHRNTGKNLESLMKLKPYTGEKTIQWKIAKGQSKSKENTYMIIASVG